jgi:hypothetical protein
MYGEDLESESDERESYQTEFSRSRSNPRPDFRANAARHYFSGKVDSGNRKLAFTGAKKLSYKDGQREITRLTIFPRCLPVQQLTTLFQSLVLRSSSAAELAYYHRYQKLALDDELKRMEDEARTGGISSNCRR